VGASGFEPLTPAV